MSIIGATGVEIEGTNAICAVFIDTTAIEPLEDISGCDLGKWSLFYGGNYYHCILMTLVDYQTISFTFEENSPGVGTDRIEYANAPSDIFDTLGRELPASNVPVV